MYSALEKLCILLSAASVPAGKIDKIVTEEDPADFADGDWKRIPYLKQEQAAAVAALGPDYIEKLQEDDILCVTKYSETYPESLADIDDPPVTLFCKGKIDLLTERCLAVVGTRKVSHYAMRAAQNFTEALCEDFVIVSGLAYGVDSIAHETTLEKGGKTVAVLGGGFNKIYPAANQGLAERIVQTGGLLVSEYPPDADPLAFHFPRRNRIVAGLSQGLLVVSAPLKSGTLSTVGYATEQGKPVFAVPGEIYDYNFLGSHRLIADGEAEAVFSPEQIAERFGVSARKKEKSEIQLDLKQQTVVNLLKRGQMHFNDLLTESKFSPTELNILLANLEFRGIIAKLAGNFYRLDGGTE